jgi:large subunit ribosomal protein L13
MNKTYSAKKSDCTHDWFLIDATDLVLGRLASFIAMRLRGKHKPMYTPNLDCGDNIVVINADKIYLTGNKVEDKKYYRHTGWRGGIKETTPKKLLAEDKADRILNKAVERMISRNPLGRQQMSKLYIYSGPVHKHEAQKPTVINFGEMNPKNVRRAK